MMKPFGLFVGLDRQLGVFSIYYSLEVVVRLGPEFKTRDDHSGGVSLNDRNVISTFPVVGAFLAVISARFRDQLFELSVCFVKYNRNVYYN